MVVSQRRARLLKSALSMVWIGALVLVALSGALPTQRAQAQSPNLLVNGSLERPYYGQGAPTRTVPNGWNIWVGAGAPDAFPHTDKVQVLDGEVSWNIKQGYVAFTAAGYQRVSGLNAGDAVKATAYGWVYTCNDTTNSCIIPDPPYRKSDTSAGASLKVGIDPKGGTDPNSPDVVWSAVAAPYDQWAEMSVTATAAGDTVTVYLYATQAQGLAMNNVYWDKVSLVRTEEAAPTPEQQYVPFVVPQGVRPDGSIVHVIQAGDTLSSIAYAYSEYGVTNESIAELNEGIRPNTRILQVGDEMIILPPGSVDPVTGQRVTPGAQPSVPEQAATPAAPVAQPTAQPNAQPMGVGTPSGGEAAAAAAANYTTTRAAFMPFEHGIMLWLEDGNQIYVLNYGANEFGGMYSAYLDTWREGMPENDPNIQPPPGFLQPERGFGQAWRTYPGVRDALGWGTAPTQGYTALVVHDDGTTVVNGPDFRVYKLMEGGAWEAVDLLAPTAPAQ